MPDNVLSNMDDDILSPLEATKDTLTVIDQVLEHLEKQGFTIPATSDMAQVLQNAKALNKAASASLAQIKHDLNIDDFVLVFEQALEMASLAKTIIRITDNTKPYLGKATTKHLKRDFPVYYHELNDVYITDLGRLAKKYLTVTDNMFVLGLLRFCIDRNIEIATCCQALSERYPNISAKVDAFIFLFNSNTQNLMAAMLQIKQLLDSTPRSPSSQIATRVVNLAQHFIPQFNIVGEGLCAGDAIMTLNSDHSLTAATHSYESAIKQLETYGEGTFSCSVYSIALRRSDLNYAKWARSIFNTILTIFDADFEHGDRIMLKLLRIDGSNGHAINIFRIKTDSNYKYYYRDVNFGLFIINNLEKFSVWFGIYLQLNGWEIVGLNIKLPFSVEAAIDYIGLNTSAANKLISWVAKRQSFSADELLALDCSTLKEKQVKILYCLFGLMVDSTENREIIQKVRSLLTTIAGEDDEVALLQLALAFQLGYNAWAENDKENAIIHFTQYNSKVTSDKRSLFEDLVPVEISATKELNFKNIWLIKKGIEELLSSMGFYLNAKCKPKLFREAYRLSRAANPEPQAVIQSALLFSCLSTKQTSQKLEHENNSMIAARNESHAHRIAFDRRFGLTIR